MAYLDQLRRIIPAMNSNLHKGQAGKVGVLGGSREYTGAPYYAAYSALKVVNTIRYLQISLTV
jgi:ATP-dependent NAD(P)H-hydrate dehydratase